MNLKTYGIQQLANNSPTIPPVEHIQHNVKPALKAPPLVAECWVTQRTGTSARSSRVRLGKTEMVTWVNMAFVVEMKIGQQLWG